MSYDPQRRLPRKPFPLSLVAACLPCLLLSVVSAQTAHNTAPATTTAATAPAAKPEPDDAPPGFQEYKGVRLGMTAEETRRKLGVPTDKTDAQDFYVVSERESVQVRYDGAKKVSAIALIYMNAGDKAPTPKAVLGDDIEALPDGSLYKVIRYPKAGYWISYSRTAGMSPIVSVTMQKIN